MPQHLKSDISFFGAVVIALLSLCVAYVFGSGIYKDLVQIDWLDFQTKHAQALIRIQWSICINIFGLFFIWLFVKPVQTLEARVRNKKSTLQHPRAILGALIVFIVAYHLPLNLDPFSDLNLQCSKLFKYTEKFNLTLAITLIVCGLWSIVWKLKVYLPRIKRNMISDSNKIDLGINSEDKAIVQIGEKGLFGNVLVYGSIGSGKTSGTIFPYARALLKFNPRASFLIIDPKGTFIRELITHVISPSSESEYLLHLTIGGKVRFNPIFEERALKNGEFVNIAQNLRAASKNYIGGGSQNAFWEVSGFNLMKNALAACAALYDYYTLNDLSKVIFQATQDTLAFQLTESLHSKQWDDEEKYNIEKAIDYFESEYSTLDQKIKTSILATTTAYLNQFQEYSISRVFCPTKEERTFAHINEVVDQGLILCYDISHVGLAKSGGILLKLLYQQSILNRLTDSSRPQHAPCVLIVDEYQDIASSGHGAVLGDDRFLAKSREAKAITIAAMQSLTSLENSLGNSRATQEIIQNFKTQIILNTSDLLTIKRAQELFGEKIRERSSRSFSQSSSENQTTSTFNHGSRHNQSESIGFSEERIPLMFANDFAKLPSFESFAQVFDGISTRFMKLTLRPYFLSLWLIFITLNASAVSFPQACTALGSSKSSHCMSAKQSGACVCGWPVPHPCAEVEFYLPRKMIEVLPHKTSSFFTTIPSINTQVSAVSIPVFGAVSEMDYHAFNAHLIETPLMEVVDSFLNCGQSASAILPCMKAMSEDIGGDWLKGHKDRLQKTCINPLSQIQNSTSQTQANLSANSCSYPIALPLYERSSHKACNSWGAFFPRTGAFIAPSSTVASLQVAERLLSLGEEVFKTISISTEHRYQMLFPNQSSCFKWGDSIGELEWLKGLKETKRLTKDKHGSYLYAVWEKQTCCKEFSELPVFLAQLKSIPTTCAVGDL